MKLPFSRHTHQGLWVKQSQIGVTKIVKALSKKNILLNMKTKKSTYLIIIIFLFLVSCDSSLKDIDGNYYKIVKIGPQEWLAGNLNVSHFRNGDPVMEVKGDKEWELAGRKGIPAWCYFNNDSLNGKQYGKLYNWYALIDPRGLAPEGWHIPDDKEWKVLIDHLGGEEFAADKMKAGSGWDDTCKGSNNSGFSGLPGGYRHYSGGFNRYDPEGGAYWWGATEGFIYISCSYPLYYSKGGGDRFFTSKGRGLSIRCVKD